MRHSPNATFKIVIAGSSGVGKSAIVQRLVEGTFREEAQNTVGVEFKPFMIPVGTETVRLQIWDTAGQERFKSVSKAYFRNGVGAVLVYAITDESTFDDVSNWLYDLQHLCSPNAYILLVGNKRDLAEDRQVGVQQAQDFADQNRLEFIETSAFSGESVAEAFTRLAFGVVARVTDGQLKAESPARASPFRAAATEQPGPQKAVCC
jgi:small GTP-binding protein